MADSVYGLVVKDVWAKFDSLGDTADQQDYTGCLLRTAGHDFMDFRWTSGWSIGYVALVLYWHHQQHVHCAGINVLVLKIEELSPRQSWERALLVCGMSNAF